MAAVCRPISYGVLLVAILLSPAPAAAQGVGGSIVGTVTDQTQAILPGVAVTVTGPALMGTRADVTAADGTYRLPNLPPGSDYVVVFELQGFSSFKREGIRLDVGFTATINATLSPAGLQENVTVSGASPVVDVTASRVATHLNAEQLKTALVGSRDYAAIMSQMPGVLNLRVDVGGANATTMQAYRAYGLAGGRGEIEGINSSQFGSQGLLGYSDMESFEDMAVNLTGNSAETPVPGPFINVVSKSGGNTYHGQFYVDYQKDAFGSRNIDDDLIRRGLTSSGGVDVRDLNRFQLFRDVAANLGGFVIKDKLWWYGGLRHTRLDRRYPVLIDDIAVTTIPAYTAKLTYNITPNHKVSAFRTYANKVFENYGVGARIVTADALIDEEYPNVTDSFTYEAILRRSLMLTVRAGHWGDFGDYKGKGQTQRYDDAGANRLYGAIPTRFDERDRPQVNGSLTYFRSGWIGSHSFKIGGEFQHEQQKYSTPAFGPNNTILYLNNTTDGRDAYTEWQVRVSSNLELPEGIELTPILRAQAGRPYAPTFIARLNYSSSVPIKASPRGEQRNDDVVVFDIRLAKALRFKGGHTIRGFVDVYNMFNTNAVQDMTTSYGANFLRPSLISGPRIARVGLRYEF